MLKRILFPTDRPFPKGKHRQREMKKLALALCLASATLPASADTITAGSQLMVFGNIENNLSTGIIEFYSGQQLPAAGDGPFAPLSGVAT
jgi:hypothetical protein